MLKTSANKNCHAFWPCLYLQDISSGCATVHELILARGFDALDNTFELAQVAVGGQDLADLGIQLPHTQSVTATGREENNDSCCTLLA